MRYFDFEKPIEVIDEKINKLKAINSEKNINQIETYIFKKKNLLKKIYSNLDPWQKVQIARHPNRPHTVDYISSVFKDFVLLAGDKKYGEDRAIIGGLGKIANQSFVIIGNEKGNTTEARLKHNFGMAKPEGYRKSQRLMLLAEKLKLPIVTFVDTAGAFPGKDAEERGQSESIATSILISLRVKTPIISLIIGEGGSGGAIALATGDKVIMLENSIYSVISPEGCSSILWRSSDFVKQAAKSLKLTANDCFKFGIVDEIIKETPGGAHRYPSKQFEIIKEKIIENINELKKINIEKLVSTRNEKYINITK